MKRVQLEGDLAGDPAWDKFASILTRKLREEGFEKWTVTVRRRGAKPFEALDMTYDRRATDADVQTAGRDSASGDATSTAIRG